MHKWIFNLARITNSYSTYLMYVWNTVNLSSFMWNCSWKRIWIFQTLVNSLLSPRSSTLQSEVQSNVPCDIERGSLIRFSVARWQKARGRPSIIRLKFQRYLRRSIFFGAHPRPFRASRRLRRGLISGVWRENPSFLSIVCLSSSAKRKIGLAGLTSTINECANKRNFREGYFNVLR